MLHVLKMRQIKKEDKLYFWSFIKELTTSIPWILAELRHNLLVVGSMEAPSKVFLLFSLFSDWLKSNHLKSKIEHDVLDIFSRHICSAVTETIWVTNYTTHFGAEKCSENQPEASEMILDPWNQQLWELFQRMLATEKKVRFLEDCYLYKSATILSSLVTTIFYSI